MSLLFNSGAFCEAKQRFRETVFGFALIQETASAALLFMVLRKLKNGVWDDT
jgi:hypothetical protein